MNPYQGLMNKNVPMVCGGLGSTLSIKKKCYYLGKYEATNRNCKIFIRPLFWSESKNPK